MDKKKYKKDFNLVKYYNYNKNSYYIDRCFNIYRKTSISYGNLYVSNQAQYKKQEV